MNDVLRVLGIVLASLLLGLVGLFLALFTICGGMSDSDGPGVLAVCLVIMAGAVTAIVILGRGIADSRTAGRGLAVRPTAEAPAMPVGTFASPLGEPAAVAAPAPRPPAPAIVAPLPPLGRTDVQVLMALRIALAVYVLVSLGSLALNAANFTRYGSAVAIQVILRNLLGVLPPLAVLVALTLRTPPIRAAVDAAAGMGIASLLFRFGTVAATGLFTAVYSRGNGLSIMLLWMVVFSTLDVAIAGLALHLRSRLGAVSAGALVVAVVGFLCYDGLVQAVLQMLTALLY